MRACVYSEGHTIKPLERKYMEMRAACVYSSQYSREQEAPEGGGAVIQVINVLAHWPARHHHLVLCDSGIYAYHSLGTTRGGGTQSAAY